MQTVAAARGQRGKRFGTPLTPPPGEQNYLTEPGRGVPAVRLLHRVIRLNK